MAQLPSWNVPGLRQPAGTGPSGQTALSAGELDLGHRPLCGGGVPEESRNYRSKTKLALEMLARALERGHLKAGWVAGDDAFGMSPSFREGLAALGMRYVLDVPGGTTVWPLEPAWTSPEIRGSGVPASPGSRAGSGAPWWSAVDELPEEAWREITVAEGSQGPRSYQFSAQRVRSTSKRKPGEIHWAVYRRNRDGSEPPLLPVQRSGGYFPGDPGLRGEGRGGALKRSSRRKKAMWGWTSTRPAPGRAGIITWPCACWAERFC